MDKPVKRKTNAGKTVKRNTKLKLDQERENELQYRSRSASMLYRIMVKLHGDDPKLGAWEKERSIGNLRDGADGNFCWPAHIWAYHMITVARELAMEEASSISVPWDMLNGPRFKFNRVGARDAYLRGYVLWYQCGRDDYKATPEELKMINLTNDGEGRTSNSPPYNAYKIEVIKYLAQMAYGTWLKFCEKSERSSIDVASAVVASDTHAPSSSTGGHSSRADDEAVRETARHARALAVVKSMSNGKTPNPPSRPIAPQRAYEIAASSSAIAVVNKLVKPLEVQFRNIVLKNLKKNPNAWHTFNLKKSLHDQVAECMDKNCMFSVNCIQPEDAPVFQALGTTCSVSGTVEKQFGDFVIDHGLDTLFIKDSAHMDPRDCNTWPDTFKGLKLKFVASGMSNSVWAPMDNVDYSEIEGFPVEVIKYLTNGSAVLRIQTPQSKNRDFIRSEDALEQMVSMADAAQCKYGPIIYAMGWQRKQLNFSGPSNKAEWGYRLHCFMKRGTKDVNDRVLQIVDKFNGSVILKNPNPDSTWLKAYFSRFMSVVWGYSSQRYVFVDAKLQNFIDTFDEMIPCGNKNQTIGVSDIQGQVRAIDLDIVGFRRIKIHTVSENSIEPQGWRLVFMHNLLVMSCMLRMNLPYAIFLQYWWNGVRDMLKQLRTQHQTLTNQFYDDNEYKEMSKFINSCTWCARISQPANA